MQSDHPCVAFHLNSLFSAFVFLPHPQFFSPVSDCFCFCLLLRHPLPIFHVMPLSGHATRSSLPLYVAPVSFFPCLAGCDCRRRRRMSRTQVQLFPLSCMHPFASLCMGKCISVLFFCDFFLFLGTLC